MVLEFTIRFGFSKLPRRASVSKRFIKARDNRRSRRAGR
jgi:hypothetical protein